jgi:hypothetical protein
MLSTRVITSLALLLAGTAFAQNATNSSVIRIEVGNGGLVFNPSSVTAAPGTKIEFDFYPMVTPLPLLSYPILSSIPTRSQTANGAKRHGNAEPLRRTRRLQLPMPSVHARHLLRLHPLPLRPRCKSKYPGPTPRGHSHGNLRGQKQPKQQD